MILDHLDRLEANSIFILREAFNQIDPFAMLWSLGKDSNVMVWLAKKAFFGHVPFPVLHIDTGKKFPEMYAFRERFAQEWDLRLLTGDCPHSTRSTQHCPRLRVRRRAKQLGSDPRPKSLGYVA